MRYLSLPMLHTLSSPVQSTKYLLQYRLLFLSGLMTRAPRSAKIYFAAELTEVETESSGAR
jgi:hypothetical protein